jgi:hypothetical protein
MTVTCQRHKGKHQEYREKILESMNAFNYSKMQGRTSVNIDNSTQEDLRILSAKTGLTKKQLVGKLAKEALQKEACTQ